MLETLKEWDRELLVFLNNLGVEQFDSFWIFVTQIESWTALFVFFSFLIFYFFKGRTRFIVFAFAILSFAISLFFTEITKDLVARIRPNNVAGFAEFIRVLQDPSSHSFFSGHASTSFAITFFMVLTLRKFNKWIYLAFLWPLLFVGSRIYVGVHYPSDIVAGALVGTLVAIVCYKICMRWVRRYKSLQKSPEIDVSEPFLTKNLKN